MTDSPLTVPDAGPISVRFHVTGGLPQTESFDYLVVACDPNLLPLDGAPPAFARTRHYQIHCSILKVRTKGHAVPFGIVLSPDVVAAMNGTIFGFRNETAKQYDLVTARGMDENLIAVYQLRDPYLVQSHPEWTPEKFRSVMLGQLPGLPWWPYGSDFDPEPLAEFTTDYFDHFTAGDLKAGAPWDILAAQGARSTIYVHASTCFESVLHCWQYANMILGTKGGPRLPSSLEARILIVGGGVSGLLFAERLFVAGYKSVRVMESLPEQNSDEVELYGKTQTRAYGVPKQAEPTVAELGTCYLSVAYDTLADYLQTTYVRNGNVRRGFSVGDASQPDFRGMVAPADMPGYGGQVLGFTDYVILRAQQKMGWKKLSLSEADRLLTEAEIVLAVARYEVCLERYFGAHAPMPRSNDLDWAQMQKPFGDYLIYNGMAALFGVMEYSYSIQGYGPLQRIPAYYGMVWISAALVAKMTWEDIKGDNLITYWSLGWGDVWRQMTAAITATGAVRIDTGVTIEAITRPPEGEAA